MFDRARKEKRWAEEKLKPEELAERRMNEGTSQLDIHIAANIFWLATGLDFGYDFDKTVIENEGAIWKIHEFWVNNKHKLTYDEHSNRFILSDALSFTVSLKDGTAVKVDFLQTEISATAESGDMTFKIKDIISIDIGKDWDTILTVKGKFQAKLKDDEIEFDSTKGKIKIKRDKIKKIVK
jgi:hypothetical protein